MSQFFPSTEQVEAARTALAREQPCDLESLMGVTRLDVPRTDDMASLLDEFQAIADALGLGDQSASGFVVLVSVRVNETTHTTPILVDTRFGELVFTSHPEIGAGVVPREVISQNPRFLADVREELLALLTAWNQGDGS